MMNRRANSDSIPMDLIPEILSILPAKSIARFCFVSKPWKSIICGEDFTDRFRTKSSANPRLLIGVKQGGGWSFFSCPQPRNHYGKSSLVVAADFHTKFSTDCYFSYASGLFYSPNMRISKKYQDDVRVICNPCTGQYAILPPDLGTAYIRSRGGLLGYDPIGKQFKVLFFMDYVDDGLVYNILTLGNEKMRWREIKCPSIYGPDTRGICINGVLYYIALCKICCFDVRSEKFKFLSVYPHGGNMSEYLINYKGKLCKSDLEYGHDGGFPLKLRMWVLQDVEKEKWSKNDYTLSAQNKVVKVHYDLSVVGVTASGEIVLAKENTNKPFYVFYFNPDTNTFLTVEIQGVREEEEGSRYQSVYVFLDHVEDLNFDVMKTTHAREDHQVRYPYV